MSNQETSSKQVLESTSANLVLEYPTGYGKTRIALLKAAQWYTKECKILIVLPTTALYNNWKEEIHKWKCDYMLPNIKMICYYSLPSYAGEYDIVIFDEGHHLSERCQKAYLEDFKVNHFILLSATLQYSINKFLKDNYPEAEHFVIGIDEAISSNVLPNPKVVLLPLTLDNKIASHKIFVNAKPKNKIKGIANVPYKDKWGYKKNYSGAYNLMCTQYQYFLEQEGLTMWHKSKGHHNAYVRRCGQRLDWLASQKTFLINKILQKLQMQRMIVFTSNTEEAKKLSCKSINSKVGTEDLAKFNADKIKHISSVKMLDEGFNPHDCKIGLFQKINSSTRIEVQRIGRILRHNEPILIFPYYIGTREEEIVNDLLTVYKDVVKLNPDHLDFSVLGL